MSITVSDIINIESLKSLKLIAGQDGLNKIINKVGILDYEFINNTEGQFRKGDFVISSFLFAKDDTNLFFDAVKSLINDGVTCLAIKDIYYKVVPPEIVDYANEKSFPIFLFDNSIFYEDLITDITDIIRADDQYQMMESKINSILHNTGNISAKETALEINKHFKDKFIVIYCKEKNIKDKNIIGLIKKYNRNKNKNDSVFKYKDSILAIITENEIDKNNIRNLTYNFISDLSINTEDFYVGTSNPHEDLSELGYGIKECLYAIRAGEILSNNLTFYKEIGAYKIILPFINEYWIKDFYDNLIPSLQIYDEKNSTDFLKTAITYIDNEGNIKGTSEALFQHENTTRYRINKIKEILKMEENHSFYEQLSMAVKIHKAYINLAID